MRCVRHDLLAGQNSGLDELANLMMADTKLCSRVAECQPLAVLVGGEAVNAMHAAQRPDTVRCPGLALAGRHSHSVQRCCNMFIRPSASHAAHDGECLLGCVTAMLAGSELADTQLGMLAAFPVDDKHDLSRRLVDVGNDLGDQRPHQSLARSHCCPWRLPCRREVISQSREIGTSIAGIGLAQCVEPLSGRLCTLQRSLPRLLQLRCNQAIVGVASGIATLCQRCFVLGLLQLQLGDAPSVLVLVSQHALGLLSRLNRHRRNGAQYLGRDYPVDALAAEAKAMSPLPRWHIQLVTPVNWQGIAAGVGNAESTATACATDETAQQGAPAPSRLRVANSTVVIAGKKRLIALILHPADVTLVMILDEHLPRVHRLVVAIALARAARSG